MSTPLILFITIHLLAFGYFVELLRRIYVRTKEYDLREKRATLPFGFIRLGHVVAVYVISYIVWIIGSIFIYFWLIDPSSADQVPRILELDL